MTPTIFKLRQMNPLILARNTTTTIYNYRNVTSKFHGLKIIENYHRTNIPSWYLNNKRFKTSSSSSSSSSDNKEDSEKKKMKSSEKKVVDNIENDNVIIVDQNNKQYSAEEIAAIDNDPNLSYVEKMEKKNHIIIGPDNVPYDPRKDPHFTRDLIFYKYPQYFTKNVGPRRAFNIIKEDMKLLKKGRIHKTREELDCPNHFDVAIFGGGIIGASIAYFIKERAPFQLSVGVFERDPTYTRASTTLSVGGIRQQFSQPENIQMSLYGIEFLRNSKKYLSILDGEPPDIGYLPQGYLMLADESQAEQLIENHRLQIELGALVELYTADRLKEKFPSLNTEGIVLGSYGVQNEGLFDPWALLLSMKAKANSFGAEFIHADVIDFNFKKHHGFYESVTNEQSESVNHVIIREPDGNVKQVEFAYGVVCAGYNSRFIAEKLGYGSRRGIRAIQFPVEPRKRYVYVANCKDGPGLDFPFLIDNSSVYCRREGLGGNFICGRSPTEDEEPDINNLDVDYSYFENSVLPALSHRVPSLSEVKLKGGWAGFYDYNTFDQNPIIGRDPVFSNILWATGFGGQGTQMAPAVGRAIMETIIDDQYQTIDLSPYGWDRLLNQTPRRKENIVYLSQSPLNTQSINQLVSFFN